MSEAVASTPLLEQYEGVKGRYPGHLVLFRVGDFYETFGDDARLLSRELDVVLTARGPDSRGERVPMAGVPHHAIDTYLGRLVRKGYKVALCDQVEDARHAQGLVRREVTRVVTPGTVVEEGILGGPDHNFLVCVAASAAAPGGYSAVDVTTGEWLRGIADGPGAEGLVSALAPLEPREILWSASPEVAAGLVPALRREFPGARLEEAPRPVAPAELPAALGSTVALAPDVDRTDRSLVAFLRATQPRLLPHLALVDRGADGRRLVLDAKTLRHLEISRPMNPDDPRGATLLGVWDETVTAAGRRTLAFWLTNPLADVARIDARLDAVGELAAHPNTLDRWRSRLGGVADLGRIASRVAGRRVRADELGRLRDGLRTCGGIGEELGTGLASPLLADLARELAPPAALLALLDASVPEAVPAGASATELLREGASAELDRLRSEEASALAELGVLERREQEGTGIKTLKVGYNQVFGHYFEVTRPNLGRVPPHFRRRQTVAQAERFVSDELLALSDRIALARDGAREAAETAWEALLSAVDAHVGRVHRVARAAGALDALGTFAHLAVHRGYVRPQVDDSSAIVVRDGRHPVLDRLLAERFVPNDVELDAERRLLVLTGPNMSGKSTYMRQVGLLVVLAQAGSFVPARFARVGVVTELFTRMGFTDEIGRAKSSFMVEMTEVASILRNAGPRSLVLLDEVGRGTSTFDGLAIAWATLRYLHEVRRTRAVLATHYHQLTNLISGLGGARNGHFAVQDRPEGVVFLHRLVPGATDRSYGVHVARLAGVPEPVLEEADRLLAELEA
ncbi:MAG TPA: DNA mismatch repair protein MutS, partial [Thermoplasmata archaeon]|nr:DNA mismatch repair protein MutS [Thermoplasmata archaeon]